MKMSLLATVAAVALIAGAGMVSAEDAKQPATKVKTEPEMKRGPDIKVQTKDSKADVKAENNANVKSENKADIKTNADKPKPQTTGQGSSEQKAAPAAKSTNEKSTTEKSGTTEKSNTSDKAAPAAKSSATPSTSTTSTTAAQGSAQSGASVSLTTEQKSKIRTSVLQSSSAPKLARNSINFSISVGTVVPRSVRFVSVPSTIVEFYPMYRGYSYFIVDDEIIIVEPRTLKIIAVLQV
jgi:hypothetical protein